MADNTICINNCNEFCWSVKDEDMQSLINWLNNNAKKIDCECESDCSCGCDDDFNADLPFCIDDNLIT